MENKRTPAEAASLEHTHTHETKQFHEEGIYRFTILLHTRPQFYCQGLRRLNFPVSGEYD